MKQITFFLFSNINYRYSKIKQGKSTKIQMNSHTDADIHTWMHTHIHRKRNCKNNKIREKNYNYKQSNQ